MPLSNFLDDPTATYRGYRRQALYCLSRLFDESLPKNAIVIPEGNEDLEICNESGDRLEIVQVKDLSTDLSASDFKPSFYHRVSEFCEPGSTVVVRIVSFGNVGPELLKALDENEETPVRVLNTLTKDREKEYKDGTKKTTKGLTNTQATNFLDHVQLTLVSEQDLTDDLIETLRKTVTAGNPERSFEILMWWLVSAAEQRLKLTRESVVKKLNEIGVYLSHLATFQKEWNTSIIPIQPSEADQDQAQLLEQEFFLGGRVTVNHIAQNFDVRRPVLLDRVHSSFEESNVVVIRSASGQGKTTLAYRYLMDFAPTEFRYEVLRASDVQHARSMATAISGHAESVGIPTLLFVDVQPGDVFWKEVVRALSFTPNLRILVTIREEDWFRSRVSEDDFPYADLPIDFDESEARELYDRFVEKHKEARFLDFDDAWAQLGEKKKLFEFVYIVSQSETLAAKIQNQIHLLREEVQANKLLPNELKLLRLVAVASAYEARVDLEKLVSVCEIPDPVLTLKRFNKEFLLRLTEDGRFVEGFHAVRSELMLSELIDPIFHPWATQAAEVLPMIEESDLETFLLSAFSRHHESKDTLLAVLEEYQPETWIGVRAISVAVKWLGVREYAKQNEALIGRVREKVGGGWWFTLDWDLALVRGKDGFNPLESLSEMSPVAERAAESAREFKKKQTDKSEVFKQYRKWVIAITEFPGVPQRIGEFAAFSECLFWFGHLQIEITFPSGFLHEILDTAFDIFPIDHFAKLTFSIRKFSETSFDDWLKDNRPEMVTKIRKEARIFNLIEEGDALIGHYLIDIDRNASKLKGRSKNPPGQLIEINDLSVERVELLSACLPGYSVYGTNGYGHQTSLFATIGDDSEKRMPVENIVMPWLPAFNAMARGMVQYQFRPKNWNDYFEHLREVRAGVIENCRQLIESIREFQSNKNGKGIFLPNSARWDLSRSELRGEFLLPKTAVDEWGFVLESSGKNELSEHGKRYTAVTRFETYRKAVDEYTRTVGNFMDQSFDTIALMPHLNRARPGKERQAVLTKARKIGLSESSIRLSVFNGVDSHLAVKHLQRLESSLFEPEVVGAIDSLFLKTERELFANTMLKWCRFTYPEVFTVNQDSKGKKNTAKTKKAKNIELKHVLQKTQKRIKLELNKLSNSGFETNLVTDQVKWDETPAMWITFDVRHPIDSMVAIEKLWHALVNAFKPDRQHIVKLKAVDIYWPRIVCVPLVQGKTIERRAFAEMGGATFPADEEVESQLWRFVPVEIPEQAWDDLGLMSWNQEVAWELFDDFAEAYAMLFSHVDHMADLGRCSETGDELGQEILEDYVSYEAERAQEFLQKTWDSAAQLYASQSEYSSEELVARPDLIHCCEALLELKNSLFPCEGINGAFKLTIAEMVDWRDRLKNGFQFIAIAKSLWIADSLGLEPYNFGIANG